MNRRRERRAGQEPAKGYYLARILIWATFLSVVMFGLGFIAGSRWSGQRDRTSPPSLVTRLMRPPVEQRTWVEKEPSLQKEQEIWKIVTEKEETGAEASSPPSTKPEPPEKETEPAKPPKPQIKPAPERRTGPFTVQVSSVKDRQRAEALVQRLQKKGYASARITKAEISGRGTWYRVRVGDFETKEEAEGLAKKIQEEIKSLRPRVMMAR